MSMEKDVASMLDPLANLLECTTPALRLLISIFMGFPLAIFHRHMLYKKNPSLQHLYFLVSGFLLGFWNFGWNVGHSAFALCATYLILLVFRGSFLCVVFTFIFNMIYLSVGYWTSSSDEYDIKWTMPHCVLTLRLIGLAFNLSDGYVDEAKLSVYQKQVALKKLPSLLELGGFVYFPGSFLVGPQFSMRRYLDFIDGKLIENAPNEIDRLPDCVAIAVKRMVLGIIYLAFYQLGTRYISDQYISSSAFANENLVKKLFLLGLWGRFHLYKYISCWLLCEAVCTAFGISYSGRDENGSPKWDGCKNVDLLTFENATQFDHYILSFNMNTNHWCAEYIYKRLKFLGSRFASQFFTLAFLAIWHGFHSGYYVTFTMEFIIMYFEKDIAPVLKKNTKLQSTINTPLGKVVTWTILKIYTLVFMGYSFAPFIFLSYTRYLSIYSSVYWIGHVLFFSYPLLAPFIKPLLWGERSHRD
ncbi:lysophospholipid acyltransferase 5 [Chelonus insularis]|uniref:lysophospholipid acyltransferase 5 n=1 Tax=Chelonus insularis TaxID=460826 RepID=UPI00158AAE76|nr:lysophospholipid acyltransferase 5 [Chelonus insularis]